MPSVGSILLTVQAKTDDLEKQLAKAQEKIRALEGTAKRSGTAMASNLTGATKAASALGENVGKAVGQKVAQGFLLASSAMKVFDKTQDEATKGLLEGGAKVASAYAIGGPVFGTVIAGLELWALNQEKVARKQKDLMEAARRQSDFRLDAADTLRALMDEDATATEKLTRKIREQGDIIEAVQSKVNVAKRFGDANGTLATNEAELRDRERIVKALGEQLRLEQALEGLRLADLSRSKEIEALRMEAAGVPTAEIGLLQQIATYQEKIAALRGVDSEAARRTTRELALQLEGTEQLLVVTREIGRSKVNEDLSREVETRLAITDEMRRQVELSREIADWTKKGASPALIEQLKAATLRAQVIQEWQPVFRTIESALTDAIVDGLTNGFRNGGDIAKRLVNTLLSQLIGSIVSSGIQALMGGIFGGGGGGLGGLGGVASALIGGVAGGGGGGGGGILPLPADTGFT